MTMLDSTIHSTTSLLVYDDISAAQDYMVRVSGLAADLTANDPDGNVGYREVRAGDHVIGLHPAASKDFQSPAPGAVTGMTVIAVDDADAHYARSVQAGAEIVQEPVDQPCGIREYGARSGRPALVLPLPAGLGSRPSRPRTRGPLRALDGETTELAGRIFRRIRGKSSPLISTPAGHVPQGPDGADGA
jgi:hypothetical protein